MAEFGVRLMYTITFTSAFHIGAGYGVAGVVDASVVRRGVARVKEEEKRYGELYIPGSSVKGRTRWRLSGLLGQGFSHDPAKCRPGAGAVCEVCNLFGSTWWESTLFFGDAVLAGESNWAAQMEALAMETRETLEETELATLRSQTQVERRNQVSISRRRRVAREELLFVSEVGQPGLRFTGTIQGQLAGQERLLTLMGETHGPTAPRDLGWLVAALGMVEEMGGRKSRGLGRCRITIDQLLVGAIGEPAAALEPVALLTALHRHAQGVQS